MPVRLEVREDASIELMEIVPGEKTKFVSFETIEEGLARANEILIADRKAAKAELREEKKEDPTPWSGDRRRRVTANSTVGPSLKSSGTQNLPEE